MVNKSGLYMISNVDILFNSVEGEHGDDIVLKLQHKAPVARIIKWHEIYE